MKIFLTLCFLIGILPYINSQNSYWEKFYDFQLDESGTSCIEVKGGYVIAGLIKDTISSRILLFKTDEQGIILWEKFLDTDYYDYEAALEKVEDDQFILITNRFYTTYDFASIIYLFNGDGDLSWKKTIRPNEDKFVEVFDAAFVGDNEVLFIGRIDEGTIFNPSYSQIYLFKLNLDGELLWEKTFGEYGVTETLTQIEVTSNNDIILGGSRIYIDTFLNESIRENLIIKTDFHGNLLWSFPFSLYNVRNWFNNLFLYGEDIIVGIRLQFGSSQYTGLVYINEDGNIEWEKMFYTEAKFRISPSPENNIFVAYQNGEAKNSFLLFSQQGDLIWENEIDNPPFPHPSKRIEDLILLEEGGYLMTGYTLPDKDVYLQKIDVRGNISLDEKKIKNSPIKIFPTIVKESLTVENSLLSDVGLKIYDLNGELKKELNCHPGKNNYNLWMLSQGEYFLVFNSPELSIKTYRIIKM